MENKSTHTDECLSKRLGYLNNYIHLCKIKRITLKKDLKDNIFMCQHKYVLYYMQIKCFNLYITQLSV